MPTGTARRTFAASLRIRERVTPTTRSITM